MFSFCNGTTASWTPSCKIPYVSILEEASSHWALVVLGSSNLYSRPSPYSAASFFVKILNGLTENEKPITGSWSEGSFESDTVQGLMGIAWPVWSAFGPVFLVPMAAGIVLCSSLTSLTVLQISWSKVWTALLLSLNICFNNNASCSGWPWYACRLAETESIFSCIPFNKFWTPARKEFSFCNFWWNCCFRFHFHWSRLALVISVGILTLACPLDSWRYCLEGDVELGPIGAVACMLGCLVKGGFDIFLFEFLLQSTSHLPMQLVAFLSLFSSASRWPNTLWV